MVPFVNKRSVSKAPQESSFCTLQRSRRCECWNKNTIMWGRFLRVGEDIGVGPVAAPSEIVNAFSRLTHLTFLLQQKKHATRRRIEIKTSLYMNGWMTDWHNFATDGRISTRRVRVRLSLVLIYGTQARRTKGGSGLCSFAIVSGLLSERWGRENQWAICRLGVRLENLNAN